MTADRTHSRAFTLSELLVVTGMIACLITLTLGAITSARQSAMRTGCLSNLHQLGVMLHSYATENGGEIPAVYGPNLQNPRPITWINPGVHKDGNGLGGVLSLIDEPIGFANHGYLPDTSILFCPGDHLRDRYNLPISRMSYLYCYVPAGGGTYMPMGFQPPVVPKVSPYHWDPGFLAEHERHSLKHGNIATTAVMVELTFEHRISKGYVEFHGKGGHILYLDGHVAHGIVDMAEEQLTDLNYLLDRADTAGN